MRKITLIGLVLLLAFLVTVPSPVAAKSTPAASSSTLTASISTPANITRGAQFKLSVQVKNPGLKTAYCVAVSASASGGFSLSGARTQSAGSLYSGAAKTVSFSASAPNTAGASGTVSAVLSWYDTSRCSTTPYRVSASAQVKVGPSGTINVAPWKLTVVVFPKWSLDDSVPVQITVTDSRGSVVGVKWIPVERGPYAATFELPAKAASYTVRATVMYELPFKLETFRLPGSQSRSVSVTRTGQSVDLYP